MATQYLQFKKRDGTYRTISEKRSFSMDEIIKEEIPYRCGGNYASDFNTIIRVVEVELDKPQKLIYETTDESRNLHAKQQLSSARNRAKNDHIRWAKERIEKGIKKYMPGDVPTTKSWYINDYVKFEFEDACEYITKETSNQIDSFVSDMIRISNRENSGSYDSYNSSENVRARARRSEEVDANLSYHRSQVERYSGRTTSQQKEWERDNY